MYFLDSVTDHGFSKTVEDAAVYNVQSQISRRHSGSRYVSLCTLCISIVWKFIGLSLLFEADRLFHSVADSWDGCNTNTSDVKELYVVLILFWESI